MAACGDYSGIERMMPITVTAHLGKSPARAQERCELTAHHDAAFAVTMSVSQL